MHIAKFSGGWFDTILQTVNTAAPLVIGATGTGQPKKPKPQCLQSVLTSDGQIAGCIDQVIAQYHQIADNPNVPLSDVLTAAQVVLDALNSGQFFGKVTPYLTDARAVMAHTIQVLQERIAGGQTVVTVGADGGLVKTTVPAQTVTGLVPTSKELITGVSNTMLFVGVGGLIGLFVILKR